jgi:hypothetical protein
MFRDAKARYFYQFSSCGSLQHQWQLILFTKLNKSSDNNSLVTNDNTP